MNDDIPESSERAAQSGERERVGTRRGALPPGVEVNDDQKVPTLFTDPGSDSGLVFLHELRRATAARQSLRWQAATHVSERYGVVLSHLYPPEFAVAEGRWITRWREDFGFHKLYYRVGPGFVQVVDYRLSQAGEETIFEDEEAKEFLQLDSVELRHNGLPACRLGAFTERLRALDFYLQGETRGLLLPFRVQRWPVPWISV